MIGAAAIHDAFRRLGEALKVQRDVEILIVGGAAALLTGQLPDVWTTADVDLIHCRLPEDRDAVLEAAGQVAEDPAFSGSWLSDFSGIFIWTLPDGWEHRRVLVGTYGRLSVWAVGRQDLMVMKFAAHRTRDLEHLAQLKPTKSELVICDQVLESLGERYPEHGSQVAMARDVVRQWRPVS